MTVKMGVRHGELFDSIAVRIGNPRGMIAIQTVMRRIVISIQTVKESKMRNEYEFDRILVGNDSAGGR